MLSPRPYCHRLFAVFGVSAAATLATTSAAVADPGAPSVVRIAPATCTGLVGTRVMGGSVTAATWKAASAFAPSAAMPGIADTPARPAHCMITGALNRRTGVDGKPYEIRFELRLPATWNGRFLYQGGGGVDGILFPADGGQMLMAETPSALARGFAVVTTDSGHQRENVPGNGDYLFAADPQARDEYGDQQLPLVYRAAIQTIVRAYGRAPDRSYFYGASNGGRQAMVAAQKHPDLFDGIIAYAGGFRLVEASIAGSIYRAQLAAKIASKTPDGTLDIEHPITSQKAAFISRRILDACDATDGAKDGMVASSIGCRVDPMRWVCVTDRDPNCLTPREAAYVRDVMAGPRLKDGTPVYSRLAADPNVTWTMVNPWISLFGIFWGELSHVYTTPPTIGPDMMRYLLSADLDTEYAKTRKTTALFKRSGVEFTNGDSPNMDAFMRHGGKLIVFTGAADQAFAAPDAAAYQDQVVARYGKAAADSFARLFIVPGFGHALPYKQSTTQVDLLTAIMDWTEQGRAPDGMVASARADADWPGRTRPLCAYPTISMYTGTGSIEDAHNFACRAVPTGK